jgi:hypothetical protein
MSKITAQAAAQDKASRKNPTVQIGAKLFEHMSGQTTFVLM